MIFVFLVELQILVVPHLISPPLLSNRVVFPARTYEDKYTIRPDTFDNVLFLSGDRQDEIIDTAYFS